MFFSTERNYSKTCNHKNINYLKQKIEYGSLNPVEPIKWKTCMNIPLDAKEEYCYKKYPQRGKKRESNSDNTDQIFFHPKNEYSTK